MTLKFYIKSKAKTFYKGDPYTDLMLWVAGNLSVAPERVDEMSLVDKPQRLITQKKYVITIKEVR